MKLLELVMIVKNSGEVLRRCLRRNKAFIDRWTILDTGSTDDTCEIVETELAGVKGRLHRGAFEDFATTRNRALSLVSRECKFLIMLDDSYVIHNGEELRRALTTSRDDCVLVKIGKLVGKEVIDSYFSKRILRTEAELRYRFRVHEEIMCDERRIGFAPSACFLEDLDSDVHVERSLQRYKRDIAHLLKDLEDYPDEQRTIYYLAKTHHIIEEMEDALKWYARLRQCKHLRADFLYSALYDVATIELLLGRITQEEFKERLAGIQARFPQRADAGYKLAVVLKSEGAIEEAYRVALPLLEVKRPALLSTIVEMDIYEYFLPVIVIELGLMLRDTATATLLLKWMVGRFPLDVPLQNIAYAISDVREPPPALLSEGRTLVIHTGHIETLTGWNPDGDKRISGSEFMALKLAREFARRGYRVVVFGSFIAPDGANYEGVREEVEFIDNEYFTEFAQKYVIDILIVSRFCSNLRYFDKTKKVYLWVHDVLPITNFTARFPQIHAQKFKSLIALSHWQKQKINERLNVPLDVIRVMRNAINADLFERRVVKTPYRFIYSSAANRGLECLVRMFPRVVERFPSATLRVLANEADIGKETLETLRTAAWASVSDRVSQEELAVEFLKSDVWMYPTHFKETYCITALEAMMARALVVSVDLAGLGETIGNRGVKVPHPLDEQQMLDKLFFVLEKPQIKIELVERAYLWAREQTMQRLADDFEALFRA